jgi:hypothetical protein
MMLFYVARLVGFVAALAPFVSAIDTITVKGRHFVNSKTGETVFVPRLGCMLMLVLDQGHRCTLFFPLFDFVLTLW